MANELKEVKNLLLVNLGYLSPIPRNLIQKVDYFIGTAGSAVMTALENKVTIAVDTNDCTPIGIIGINADSTTFSSGCAESDNLHDYLDKICYSNIRISQ